MTKLEQAAQQQAPVLMDESWCLEPQPVNGLLSNEQAEQEPVAVVEITYGREPECYVTGNIDDFPEGVFKLYAAPVRTKDLTDQVNRLKDHLSDATEIIQRLMKERDALVANNKPPAFSVARKRLAKFDTSVQQVDLSDDEIAKAVGSPLDEVYLADFRAVIAALKEKNK